MVKVFSSHRFKDFRTPLNVFFNDLPRITKYRYFKFMKDKPGVVMIKEKESDILMRW